MAAVAPVWIFTPDQLQNTPSRADGVTFEQEVGYKKTGAVFLQEAGIKLKMPQLTIATAITFYQRFFTVRSFKQFDRSHICTACLFLAGKVEDTPKKLRDVICCTHFVAKKAELKDDSKEFWDLREKILSAERVLLHTIAFDFVVDHPYRHLLALLKQYNGVLTLFETKGTKEVLQIAWNFVNDSLRTSLLLQYRPQLIASAALHLAARYVNSDSFKLPENFLLAQQGAVKQDMDTICDVMLELYESVPQTPQRATPRRTETPTAQTSSERPEKTSSEQRSGTEQQRPSETSKQSSSNPPPPTAPTPPSNYPGYNGYPPHHPSYQGPYPPPEHYPPYPPTGPGYPPAGYAPYPYYEGGRYPPGYAYPADYRGPPGDYRGPPPPSGDYRGAPPPYDYRGEYRGGYNYPPPYHGPPPGPGGYYPPPPPPPVPPVPPGSYPSAGYPPHPPHPYYDRERGGYAEGYPQPPPPPQPPLPPGPPPQSPSQQTPASPPSNVPQLSATSAPSTSTAPITPVAQRAQITPSGAVNAPSSEEKRTPNRRPSFEKHTPEGGSSGAVTGRSPRQSPAGGDRERDRDRDHSRAHSSTSRHHSSGSNHPPPYASSHHRSYSSSHGRGGYEGDDRYRQQGPPPPSSGQPGAPEGDYRYEGDYYRQDDPQYGRVPRDNRRDNGRFRPYPSHPPHPPHP